MAIVTAADVARWADLQLSTDDTAVMTAVIDAVEVALGRSHDVPDPAPADVVQAVTMQAARLYRRRSTPDGIAAFGEQYATRVARFDPDIDALLAPYQRWALA